MVQSSDMCTFSNATSPGPHFPQNLRSVCRIRVWLWIASINLLHSSSGRLRVISVARMHAHLRHFRRYSAGCFNWSAFAWLGRPLVSIVQYTVFAQQDGRPKLNMFNSSDSSPDRSREVYTRCDRRRDRSGRSLGLIGRRSCRVYTV
jgi:hypothetical protein